MTAGLTRDQVERLVNDHCVPGPGAGLVGVMHRLPYETRPQLFYVPEEELARATSAASQASARGESTASMATTSAGVAAGKSESAMARAVISRSYTRTAARPSSVRPLRSMMLRRRSNGSVLFCVLMLSLLAAKGAALAHRNPAQKGGVA